MTKICSKCREPKPKTEFRKDSRYKGGRFCWCAPCCREYDRSPEKRKKDRINWAKRMADPKNREARRNQCRERYATPEGKRQHKDRHYRRVYGITWEFFESEVKRQKGICPLCRQPRDLVADHNHKTGKYRGAICKICNSAVSRIEDFPDFVSRVKEYVL